MRLPPLNALKCFECAARSGSYVKAAQELRVTPAAVSQQVRQLEAFFRRKLFVRYNNRIALSDAGQAIYAGVAPALDDIASLTERLRGGADRSSLVVSVLPSLAECWFAPRFARLALASGGPKLDLRVEEDPVDFASGRIDFRLTYGAQLYPDLVTVPLFRDSVTPFCSVQFQTQQLASVGGLARLPDEYLIRTSWGPDFASHPGWNDWFSAAGVKRQIDEGKGHRAGSSLLALELARHGLGVALGQQRLAAEMVRRGELVALSDKAVPLGHDYCAVYPEARARKPGLRQLLAMATDS